MALGALIAAYQEDDEGGLRALLPLAGQSLIEYQARCLAAAGIAPIVVLIERIPPALNEAFERLRIDGIPIVSVGDGMEAATRFEAGALILLLGDGIVPPPDMIANLVNGGETAVLTVADDTEHERYERIDARSRWAGVAIVDAHLLASTAAMLGDWDLQSTLLRRVVQEGAIRIPVGVESGEPLLVDRAEQLADFERAMIAASRGARRDFSSRYLLPPVEDFVTGQLIEAPIRPAWLIWGALTLSVLAAAAFFKGWPIVAMACLLLSTPLDLIAARIATLRLRPLPAKMLSRRLLWPVAGLALLALGWWQNSNGGGWGSVVAALAAVAFAEAARAEAPASPLSGEAWLFSRRNAIVLALPFSLFGAWNLYLAAMALYAAASFFLLQHIRHRLAGELTRD
ncbi:MAG: NTP transferase domain-containing protein [Sphingomicrobium sp.]